MGDICLKWSPEFIIHKEVPTLLNSTVGNVLQAICCGDRSKTQITYSGVFSCTSETAVVGTKFGWANESRYSCIQSGVILSHHTHILAVQRMYCLVWFIFTTTSKQTERIEISFHDPCNLSLQQQQAWGRLPPMNCQYIKFTAVNGPSRILACLSASRLSILASRARTSERGRSLTSPLACHWLTSHNVPQMDCLLAG